ncbi:MAG TPA: hypothetical protein VMV20_02045 [Chitinophagaceae bacterium]|nr:hypothetical protein [Chitinophagaceae bacterium]
MKKLQGILPSLRSWFNRQFRQKPGFGSYVLDRAQPLFKLCEPA